MTDYKALVADLRDADQANWKRLSQDAAAAIEALQADMKTYGDTAFKEGYEMGFAAGEARAEKRMEPKRGKWITDPHGVRWCSVCDSYYQDVGYGWNYCPNCGAKMEVQDG